MNTPKKFLILLSVVMVLLVFTQCEFKKRSAHSIIFQDNEWYYGDKPVFRNDSSFSFSAFDTIANKFIKPLSFPIQLTDSTLVYHRFQERGYYNQNREFQITFMEEVIDTVKYDLKYINKQPKLILYLEPFPIILKSKLDLMVAETRNFDPIKFVIIDYSIGDQIDRSLLKTRGIYNYPSYTIEDCEYIDNKDITFKIIGYNSIYSIERRRIEDYRVKEIVNVVTSKLGFSPEYRPMRQWIEGSDYEYEFYRWSGHGVQINLSRSKYIGADSYKTLIISNDWTLSYDDSFLQAILVETFKNGKPQSSIIN
ncbi:MAG: hypothetical protein M0P66_00655 [Salinivirgaceae bacterium]|nr:hypothetical protein [Salinivirgaceae bacterium]